MAKKKKKRRGLTSSSQKELEKQVRKYIGRGFSDLMILEKLGLEDKPQTLTATKNRINVIDSEEFHGYTSVKVYTEFIEKCRQNINDLSEMQTRFKYKGQYNALVACIAKKHDINKDVLKIGQQMGFIEQKGNEISVETELSFTTMTTEDVQDEVAKEVARLNDLASGENIIEMRPELLATLEEDERRIKKYIPSEAFVEPERLSKPRIKTKIKVKLKKRI